MLTQARPNTAHATLGILKGESQPEARCLARTSRPRHPQGDRSEQELDSKELPGRFASTFALAFALIAAALAALPGWAVPSPLILPSAPACPLP